MEINLKIFKKEEKLSSKAETYIDLGEDSTLSNTSRKVHCYLVVPEFWINKEDILDLPVHTRTLPLKYEFFHNGQWHLVKEEDIPIYALDMKINAIDSARDFS